MVMVAMNRDDPAVKKINECVAILQKPNVLQSMKDGRALRAMRDRAFLSEKEREGVQEGRD
jgi:hypothetical protein